MSDLLANLPFPPEALIPIIIVVAQLLAYYKDKKEKKNAPPELFEPTDEERDIIWERQTGQQETEPPPVPVENIPTLKEILFPEPRKTQPPPEPPATPATPLTKKFVKPEQPPALPQPSKPAPAALAKRPSRKPSTRSALLASLANPSTARNAIVLVEVLGPPRSQRPLS